MSTKTAFPPIAAVPRLVRRRPVSRFSYKHALLPATPPPLRCLTTSSTRYEEMEIVRVKHPRWQQTPSAMVAPFRLRPRNPENEYRVNEDPDRLDQIYIRVLGNGGDKLLTDEAKWLAVTHKSFDHGRRGFNDRLAFFGKRIVDLQTCLALLSPASNAVESVVEDKYGRVPFQHPALQTLPLLNQEARATMQQKSRLATIAENYGLVSVLRWKPKKADNVKGSGIEVALSQALYAIVGAVSLQNGGEVANRIARERILAPLGLK